MNAQTLAAKAAQALTDATAGLSTTETERLAGATSLTLALEDAGSWTLRWDQATSKPQLVAGEEEAKAKHIVSLLAVQKHGPGLTSLLENLRRNRHPSFRRRASAVVAAASPLKMSRAGL